MVVAGLGLVVWGLVRAQVSFNLAVLIAAAIAVLTIATTRAVLETGAVFFCTPISLIDGVLYSIRHSVGHVWQSIAGISSCYSVFEGSRNFTAQAMGHANKLAGSFSKHRKRLGASLLVALAVAAIACIGSSLWLAYTMGALNARSPRITTRPAQTAVNMTYQTMSSAGMPAIDIDAGETPRSMVATEEFEIAVDEGIEITSIDARRGWFFTGGLAVMVVVYALRLFVVWWPIHPIGLLLGHSDAASHAFLSVFLAWLIKAVAFRIGGVRALRKLAPCFVGLLAGFAVGMLGSWLIAISAGLIDCAMLNHWSWDVFLQREWPNLIRWPAG
jgi:hypothetical protein